jgi:hypothetical protein
MWIDMNRDDKLPFYGIANQPNLSNLKKGWSLLATGVDINNLSTYKFKKIMKFNAFTQEWITSPRTLKAGDGFLVLVK